MDKFQITEEVVHGQKLGRVIGFPTANMNAMGDCPVDGGVYHSHTFVDGKAYNSMTNYGNRPSVGGQERLFETHLFDCSLDLYGKTITVVLDEKIRDERKFDSLTDLKNQLESDARRCQELGLKI